jgi:hypothetical protein
MAGDWIKVEHATPQKPEVAAMAEMLGVSQREMVGILMDYMIWLDVNARHANVTLMSRKRLDSVLRCDGLASCLEAVGWVEWDDGASLMRVTKYDRHNGESSKNRALAAERKRKQRAGEQGKCVTQMSQKIVTREEESREEKKTPSAALTLTAEGIEGFTSADLKAWAAAFPAISVPAEIRRAAEWLKANPKNRKSNYRRFLVGWFTRAQDRAPRVVVPLNRVAL